MEWFHSEYAPLPSLLQSAQLLFRENTFPQIKRAHSAGIPVTLQKLNELAQYAKQEGSHHLALITGVPGAGKTLVGLQFVFDTYAHGQQQKAVILSGNGPLVDVLQYSLSNINYVQAVHTVAISRFPSRARACQETAIAGTIRRDTA
jgi:Cdc6-like AAA superfamily ATPase